MTRDAPVGRTRGACHVARVIEPDVKALQSGERLDRTRSRVRVTDSADGTGRVGELLRVTTGAGHVARQPWAHGVVVPAVAQQARQARVSLVVVHEAREVARLCFHRTNICGHGRCLRFGS